MFETTRFGVTSANFMRRSFSAGHTHATHRETREPRHTSSGARELLHPQSPREEKVGRVPGYVPIGTREVRPEDNKGARYLSRTSRTFFKRSSRENGLARKSTASS